MEPRRLFRTDELPILVFLSPETFIPGGAEHSEGLPHCQESIRGHTQNYATGIGIFHLPQSFFWRANSARSVKRALQAGFSIQHISNSTVICDALGPREDMWKPRAKGDSEIERWELVGGAGADQCSISRGLAESRPLPSVPRKHGSSSSAKAGRLRRILECSGSRFSSPQRVEAPKKGTFETLRVHFLARRTFMAFPAFLSGSFLMWKVTSAHSRISSYFRPSVRSESVN